MDYLDDSENDIDPDIDEDEWEDEEEDLDYISYVCEDCDYRWEEPGEEDSSMMVCPMCGSVNVTQL